MAIPFGTMDGAPGRTSTSCPRHARPEEKAATCPRGFASSVFGALLFTTLAATSASGQGSRSLTDLSGPWQLLVDDYLISAKANVVRRYHAFEKHKENPVVVVDRPWERDIVKCAAVLPTEDGSGF